MVGNRTYVVLQRVDRGGAEARKEDRRAEHLPRSFHGYAAPIMTMEAALLTPPGIAVALVLPPTERDREIERDAFRSEMSGDFRWGGAGALDVEHGETEEAAAALRRVAGVEEFAIGP